MKFKTGKDYPALCKECRQLIDDVAELFGTGLLHDTNDPEAPIKYIRSNNLFCGGYKCADKQAWEEIRAEDHNELRRKELYGHA